MTRGSAKDPKRNQANKIEAQLNKIMYGEESVARERKKEGARVTHKKRKRGKLSNRKTETKYARRQRMAGAPARSERDEEAEEEEGGSHSPMDQVEGEEGPMREPE